MVAALAVEIGLVVERNSAAVDQDFALFPGEVAGHAVANGQIETDQAEIGVAGVVDQEARVAVAVPGNFVTDQEVEAADQQVAGQLDQEFGAAHQAVEAAAAC